MANLTSTVPGAFNALYGLLAATGAIQSPAIPVFHSEVLAGQLTQNGYVLLGGIDGHSYKLAALGSYAHEESYDICGCVAYYQGGPDPVGMVQDVLNKTWAIYQNVVMTTVVANRGANGTYVLGDSSNPVMWILPVSADYTGSVADDQSGFEGQVEFRYNIRSRITVT